VINEFRLRIMKRGATYLQGYNCQIAVDRVALVTASATITRSTPSDETPRAQRVNTPDFLCYPRAHEIDQARRE
jgi:hypothetical protein